jgi:hypothetical protein
VKKRREEVIRQRPELDLSGYTNVNFGLKFKGSSNQCYIKTSTIIGFTRKSEQKKIEQIRKEKVKKPKVLKKDEPKLNSVSHKDPKPPTKQTPRVSSIQKEFRRLKKIFEKTAAPLFTYDNDFSPKFMEFCPVSFRANFTNLVNFESKFPDAASFHDRKFIIKLQSCLNDDWFQELFPDMKSWIFKKDIDPGNSTAANKLIFAFASDLAKIIQKESYIY